MRVGVSSWADPALIESGRFYPRRSMSAEARLRFYASVFDVVEVNASYYAIPSPVQTRHWVERTPPDFVFHVKAYALMTGHHPRAASLPAEVMRLVPEGARRTHRDEVHASAVPAEGLDETFRLFRASIAPLVEAGRLGYVLFQFAPWVRRQPGPIDYLATLRARLPGVAIAVEFRDHSWFGGATAETLAVLRAAGLAHVVVDGPVAGGALPRIPAVTAEVGVMRLHGRNAEGWLRQIRGEEPSVREKYDHLYAEDELRELVPEIEGLAGEAGQVFISFNNNNRDYPVQNARMLRRLLGQPAREAPVQRNLSFGGSP